MEDRTTLNRQLAQMLKGGVIIDVKTPEFEHFIYNATFDILLVF